MDATRTGLDELLRRCIQCGLCMPHCATYLASGDEVQSPRGRLVLLGEVLADEGAPPPDAFLAAFDQCIGCRACETVCPSGVPYALLEHGHELVDRRAGGVAVPDAAVPGPVLRSLDRPAVLRLLGTAAAAARSVARLTLGRDWRSRLDRAPTPLSDLARLAGSVPRSPRTDRDLVRLLDGLVAAAGGRPVAGAPGPWSAPAAGPLRFFAGCANAGLLAPTSRRLLDCARLAGHTVRVPSGQDCCGALASHTGRPGRAATLHRRNRAALGDDAGTPLLVEAAGCGLELAAELPEVAGDLVDAATLLVRAAAPPARTVPLKVVVHDPCHARHGLGQGAAVRDLLDRIPGLCRCDPDEIEVCCGSGGAWGLRYPEMSADLARRKAADLAATGADLVVTTNPGCLGQIADGLAIEAPDLPILPVTDLWWYAVRRPDNA